MVVGQKRRGMRDEAGTLLGMGFACGGISVGGVTQMVACQNRELQGYAMRQAHCW